MKHCCFAAPLAVNIKCLEIIKLDESFVSYVAKGILSPILHSICSFRIALLVVMSVNRCGNFTLFYLYSTLSLQNTLALLSFGSAVLNIFLS